MAMSTLGPDGQDAILTPLLERIRSRCQVTAEGCWLWTGARTGGNQFHKPRRPRPEMRVNGKVVYVARVVVGEVLGRPIRDGYHAGHTNGCRNPVCVSPEHLEEQSEYDNSAEAARYQWNGRRRRMQERKPLKRRA